MSEMKLGIIKDLRARSGCSVVDAKKALEYANGDMSVAMAYLRAKSCAVATPRMSFDERVKMFLNQEGRT